MHEYTVQFHSFLSGVEYRGGTVIQTFMDTLAQKTCAITATFQQLQISRSNSTLDTQDGFIDM